MAGRALPVPSWPGLFRPSTRNGAVASRAVWLLAALLPVAMPAAASARPASIVSINLCADELVLRLAGTDRVKSVTWLARDSLGSTVRDAARDIPVNRGLAEEIVPLEPDLVVAGIYTTRTAVAFLRRLGVRVEELDVPATLDAVRAQIHDVSEMLGVPEAGKAMVEDIDRRLAALPPASEGRRPTALVLRPNGYTAGAGSLVDELLTRAGFTNLSASLDVDRLGQIPLEMVVQADPDVLILNADADAPASMAQALLHHPALARIRDRALVVEMPTRMWTCAGPQIADAAAILADAAARAAARREVDR